MLVPAALSTVLYVAFKVSGRVLAPWLRGETTNAMLTDALGSPVMLKWPAAGPPNALPRAPPAGDTVPDTHVPPAAAANGARPIGATVLGPVFLACGGGAPAGT